MNLNSSMILHKLCNTFARKKILSFLPRNNFFQTANCSTCVCKKKPYRKKDKLLQYEPRLCSKPKMKLSKKNAMIIGGTSDIGFETATWLLIAGVNHLIITGRDEDRCKQLAKALNKCHGCGRVSSVCLDVQDPDAHEEVLMYAVDKVCSLDILVHCFGLMNGENFEDEIDINLNCLIRGTLLAYDFMGTDSVGFGGIIINVAGTMGLEPMTGAATFAACKHAVVGFSRSYGNLTTEASTKVRLVTLCPGFTRTSLWDDTDGKAMPFCEWELEKNLICAHKQMPEACGKAMLYLTKYAENGSVWVIEGSRLYELNYPPRRQYSKHVQTFAS